MSKPFREHTEWREFLKQKGEGGILYRHCFREAQASGEVQHCPRSGGRRIGVGSSAYCSLFAVLFRSGFFVPAAWIPQLWDTAALKWRSPLSDCQMSAWNVLFFRLRWVVCKQYARRKKYCNAGKYHNFNFVFFLLKMQARI